MEVILNKIFKGVLIDILIVSIGAFINGWYGTFCALALVSYLKVVTQSCSNPLIIELLKKIEHVEEGLKNNTEFSESLQKIAKELKE